VGEKKEETHKMQQQRNNKGFWDCQKKNVIIVTLSVSK